MGWATLFQPLARARREPHVHNEMQIMEGGRVLSARHLVSARLAILSYLRWCTSPSSGLVRKEGEDNILAHGDLHALVDRKSVV
jgi:hypothetical protein